jgi:predicted HAD superfamily Cof-like phosphohydrolase
MEMMMEFDEAILKFNEMYGLPISELPSLDKVPDVKQRITDFMDILHEEVHEGRRIVDKFDESEDIDVLTDLADWLGDIQIFCASEMAKYGIPLNPTMNIIMQSNFSKQGADGKPIYDERGKVCKGPHYWKPEPRLKVMLENYKKD